MSAVAAWIEEGCEGEPWDHVSVSTMTRCPTWEEMQWVKEQFFEDEEVVMQLHQAKSQYINDHPYVLHLWRPAITEIQTPPSWTV